MSVKLAAPGLLKIKIFKRKVYDVITVDCDASNQILLRD